MTKEYKVLLAKAATIGLEAVALVEETYSVGINEGIEEGYNIGCKDTEDDIKVQMDESGRFIGRFT